MGYKNWKKEFAPHILERGLDYYEQGRVGKLTRDGDSVTAGVHGSDTYEVELEFKGNRLSYSSCTCPYAEGGQLCKHMAAVAYATENPQPAKPSVRKKGISFKEVVKALSAEQAKKLLLDIASDDELLQGRIITLATGTMPTDHLSALKGQVNGIVDEAEDRDGYIDYYKASDFYDSLSNFLYDEVEPLFDAGLIMESFELCCYVFDAAASSDADDSDGGLSVLFNCCKDLWKAQYNAATPEQREKMYDWFDKAAQAGYMDYTVDVLTDIQLSLFNDKGLIEKSLSRVDARISAAEKRVEQEKGSWSAGYELSHAVMSRIELMKKLKLPENDVDAFISKYQRLPDVRQLIVDGHLTQGRYAQAVELLQRSKELDRELPGLVCSYSKKLIHIYETVGDAPALYDELIYQVFKCRQDDLKYIHMLKKHTKPEDWAAMLERLLAAPTVSGISLALLESEGLWQRLLEDITQNCSCGTMDTYEIPLLHRYPDEVRDFYLNRLRENMPRASNRGAYRSLIIYLKKVAKYPGGEAYAKALADEWRKQFPRRTSMIDELNKAGFR